MTSMKSLPTYRRENLEHPCIPAQCPADVGLPSISLGWPPSLRPLRRGRHRATSVEPLAAAFVRGLPRYYGAIRLPTFVHHRRASEDFPMRPAPWSGSGERGTSRFPCEVFPCMHRVFDRAGFRRVWRQATRRMWPSASPYGVGTPEYVFRGWIPGLHVPLSTLRRRPYGRLRMTRGRCGSLHLQRVTLSFPAPHRF